MELITIDFETYYDKDISLKKLTTEEYIRHPEFEVIGMSIKVNDGETHWLSGDFNDLKEYVCRSYNWSECAVLAHNCMFDGAILHWLLVYLLAYGLILSACLALSTVSRLVQVSKT